MQRIAMSNETNRTGSRRLYVGVYTENARGGLVMSTYIYGQTIMRFMFYISFTNRNALESV